MVNEKEVVQQNKVVKWKYKKIVKVKIPNGKGVQKTVRVVHLSRQFYFLFHPFLLPVFSSLSSNFLTDQKLQIASKQFVRGPKCLN